MIKLLCPNCMKSVSVPDDAAGRDAPCPECGQAFAVPSRYDAVVSAPPPAPVVPVVPPPPVVTPAPARQEPPSMSTAPPEHPAPPPGFVPPETTQFEPPLPPTPPPPPIPHGYTHSRGFSLSPRVMAWVPAVGLTLILLLTFLNWVGSYVGGHAVYAQSAWRSAARSVARDFPLERLMEQQAAWPTDVLNKVRTDWLMVPYLIALIVAVVFAWAERMVAALDRTRLPPPLRWVAAVWPYRIPVIAALATVAFILLVAQASNGFGLERAMKGLVGERFAAERTASAGNPAALDAIDFKQDQELSRFNLERTTWFYLALALHVAVVLAMLVRAALERRGNRPPPRFVYQY